METVKPKSLKINMILNAIKGLMAIIFPLISFPYVSRILGVEVLGKYNFATSIISYFLLLSSLGINTYAIREGARYRNNKEKFNKLANQIFSINVISTIISYVLFFILLIIVPKFQSYKVLLIILSIQIIFKTIGIEWLYSIYEDYMYITIRSILFQLASIISLFLFVKSPSDLNIYALITVIANAGSNILNYFHAKAYCRVKFTKDFELSKHLKPILILFAMNVTVSIYVNSDITILGFLKDEYTVGIYSVSTKVYSIIKSVLSAILAVSIPRLSSFLGDDSQENKEKFKAVANKIHKTLLTLVLPAAVGLIMLRKEIILIIADNSYLEATTSLMLLSISLIFVFEAYYWSQCILIPYQKDSTVMKATIISASINIILNFILIPKWSQNAAALTTIIAEFIVFSYCFHTSNKIVKLENISKTLLKVGIGCFGIVITVLITQLLVKNYILCTILSIIISVLMYGIIEIMLKNELIYETVNKINKKLRRV